MFWSKKKIDDDKDRQIRDLKSVFPSIRRPNNDDSLFELKFVVDNQYSSLRIFIPADFPMTRPVLQVAGPVTHPWLDQFKQVNGCEKLMNWTKSSSLVEVVEESMSALLTGVNGASTPAGGPGALSSSSNASINYANTSVPSPSNQHSTYHPSNTNPTHGMTMQQAQQYNQQLYGLGASGPSALNINNPSALPASNNSSSSSSANYGNNQGLSANAAAGGKTPITMPEIPNSFPELEKLTDVQLERLLNDEVALETTLSKIASVEAIQQLCEQLRDSNNDLASRNLILEGDITMLQKRANELHTELATASHKYHGRLADLSKKYAPKADVLAELNKKKDTLDNTSEDLGKNFVDGKVELSAFVQEYMEVRTNYHTLNSKLSVTQ